MVGLFEAWIDNGLIRLGEEDEWADITERDVGFLQKSGDVIQRGQILSHQYICQAQYGHGHTYTQHPPSILHEDKESPQYKAKLKRKERHPVWELLRIAHTSRRGEGGPDLPEWPKCVEYIMDRQFEFFEMWGTRPEERFGGRINRDFAVLVRNTVMETFDRFQKQYCSAKNHHLVAQQQSKTQEREMDFDNRPAHTHGVWLKYVELHDAEERASSSE